MILSIICGNREKLLKYHFHEYCVFGILNIFRKFYFKIWEQILDPYILLVVWIAFVWESGVCLVLIINRFSKE